EEPLFPPEDYASLCRLQRDVGISLAAGENACTVFDFQKMIAADAVTYLQPSVTKAGGITEFRKVLALAQAHGRAVAPHTPYYGPGLLASLHLLATMGDDSLVEILCVDGLEATPYGEATAARDGVLQVPQGPGLGLDPDPDVLKDYAA
ncbi:MAG: mandelate racemase/muconate lactonizing enzyme family protein, partial [Gammaproteobacteria bacterium]|nr:mandelate racemase/muconate lactonizing enzyme family protein [Gammaproteobacteria bacterium]